MPGCRPISGFLRERRADDDEPTRPHGRRRARLPAGSRHRIAIAEPGAEAPSRVVAARRAPAQGRLQAFRLGQPGRAEGRPRQAMGRRHIRQPQQLQPPGRAGRRHWPDLRSAHGVERRRGDGRVRPRRGMDLVPARLFVGHVRAACRRALPRRPADHAGGRDLLARRAEEGAPVLSATITRTSCAARRPASAR